MYSTNIYWIPGLYGVLPDGSVAEESTCNIGVAGDGGSISGLRGSPEGGNDNPLHILAWEITWKEEPGRLQSMGCQESDTTEQLSMHTYFVVAMVLLL